MKIEILFENDNFLVINKPAGLMVHPASLSGAGKSDGRSKESTVVDWILEKYPEIKNVGEGNTQEDQDEEVLSLKTNDYSLKTPLRPGIVHRLDEETSGVLIVAKTQEAFEYFKEQFKNRTIKKEYHAFVWGHFKEDTGVVDAPIGRSGTNFRLKLSGRGARGEMREAETAWIAVKQFADENGDNFSFMRLFPKTGRTHQLRVHMKYLQRPIVADHAYATAKPDVLGFTRLALHARKISFLDQNGEKVEVEAPYPSDFEGAIAKYVKA